MRPCRCGSTAYEVHRSCYPAPGYEVHKCQDCGRWWSSFNLIDGHANIEPWENKPWKNESEVVTNTPQGRRIHTNKRTTEGWTIV